MNDDLRDQIYSNMLLKETDELIEIWQKHDTGEWTEMAFEVVREILQNRLGELPLQDEFDNEDDENGLEDNAAPAADTIIETVENADIAKKNLACPNCKGKNLFTRDIGLSFGAQRVV